MATYSSIRSLNANQIPTTINLLLTGNIFKSDNFEIGSSSVTASKPLKLNASKQFTSGDINLTSEVTGTLPIANGGTNSAVALNNNRIMISVGGAIVEQSALTANRALATDASGLPVVSATTDTELGYVSGVTSSIQTQLGSKLDKSGGTMTGFITLHADPTNALHAATKQYVDLKAITGGVVKEAILITEQLDTTDGINAAEVVYFNTNPVADDTVVISDGTTTETFTFKASASVAFEVTIGGTAAETMQNLATAILTDSTAWDAKFEVDGLDAINSAGVVVVYEQASAVGASTSRIYGTWATATDPQVVQYHDQTQYVGATAIQLPSADPAAGRFGFRKQVSALSNGEIHLALSSDELREWNADATEWFVLSGPGSIPNATSASGGGIKGKLSFDSDKGLALTAGVGEVKINTAFFEFSTGNISIKANGITGTEIRLANATYLRARNAANDGDVSLIGADASDNIVVKGAANKAILETQPTGTVDLAIATTKYVNDQGAIVSFSGVAGESFSANTTYLVRYAVTGETAGTVYKATSDEQNASGKSYAIGFVRATSAISATDPVTVYKFNPSVALLSGDTNVGSATTDNGKPIYLNKDGGFSLSAPTGITSTETYAIRQVGVLVSYNATVTSTLIMMDVSIPAWFGFDIAA